MIYAEPVPSGIKGKEYDRILKQNRAKAGLCVNCGKNPAAKGRKACLECLSKERERKARINAELIKRGLCISCKKNPAEPGKQKCAECNRKDRDSSAEWRKRCKEQGLCITCGKRPPRPGKTQCTECAIRQKKYKRPNGNRKLWNNLGLCRDCGGERVPGKYYCAECLKKHQEIAARARQIKEAKNHGLSM